MADTTNNDRNLNYVGLWFSEDEWNAGQGSSDFESPLSYLTDNKESKEDGQEET